MFHVLVLAQQLYKHAFLEKRCDYPVMRRLISTSFLDQTFKEAGIADILT
jgi:hypothetical protein